MRREPNNLFLLIGALLVPMVAAFLSVQLTILSILLLVATFGVVFIRVTQPEIPIFILAVSSTFVLNNAFTVFRGLSITDVVLMGALTIQIRVILRYHLWDGLLRDPVFWGMMIFMISGLIGAAFSNLLFIETITDALRWGMILLFYIYGRSLINHPRQPLVAAIALGIVLGGIATSVVGMYEIAIRQTIDFPSLTTTNMGTNIRATGLANNTATNATGEYLAFALPWVIWGFNSSKAIYTRFFYLIAGIIIPIGLVITVSRGGFLAAGFAILVYFMLSSGRFKLVIASGIAAILGFLIVDAVGITATVDEAINRRYELTLQEDDYNFLLRLELNDLGVQVWSEHPFFGTGLGTFTEVAATHPDAGPLIRNRVRTVGPISVHNSYLLALAESGVIGGIGIIGALSYGLWRAQLLFRQRRDDPALYAIAVTIVASLIATLVSTLTKDSLPMRHLWFLLGVLASQHAQVVGAQERQASQQRIEQRYPAIGQATS